MVAQVNSATCAPVLFATPVGKRTLKGKCRRHAFLYVKNAVPYSRHGQTKPHASELHASQVPIDSILACTK